MTYLATSIGAILGASVRFLVRRLVPATTHTEEHRK